MTSLTAVARAPALRVSFMIRAFATSSLPTSVLKVASWIRAASVVPWGSLKLPLRLSGGVIVAGCDPSTRVAERSSPLYRQAELTRRLRREVGQAAMR